MKVVEQKNIFLDILFTLITFGLFNLWVQYRQMKDYNYLVRDNEFSPFFVLLFSILTFGIYFAYHEYKLTKKLHQFVYAKDYAEMSALAGIATFFGLWFLVDSYQQHLINMHVENSTRVIA